MTHQMDVSDRTLLPCEHPIAAITYLLQNATFAWSPMRWNLDTITDMRLELLRLLGSLSMYAGIREMFAAAIQPIDRTSNDHMCAVSVLLDTAIYLHNNDDEVSHVASTEALETILTLTTTLEDDDDDISCRLLLETLSSSASFPQLISTFCAGGSTGKFQLTVSTILQRFVMTDGGRDLLDAVPHFDSQFKLFYTTMVLEEFGGELNDRNIFHDESVLVNVIEVLDGMAWDHDPPPADPKNVEQEIEYEMYTRALVSVLPRPQHGEDGIGEDGIVTPASVRLMPACLLDDRAFTTSSASPDVYSSILRLLAAHIPPGRSEDLSFDSQQSREGERCSLSPKVCSMLMERVLCLIANHSHYDTEVTVGASELLMRFCPDPVKAASKSRWRLGKKPNPSSASFDPSIIEGISRYRDLEGVQILYMLQTSNMSMTQHTPNDGISYPTEV